jgi:hypothetical protein
MRASGISRSKLGQPHPELNFDALSNNGVWQALQR